MASRYRLTSQAQVRKEFWETHPDVSRTRVTDYSGNGKMYPTDTRVAFSDFVDMLSKDGAISRSLAHRVTLSD